MIVFFFSRKSRHTSFWRDWSSDVCSSVLEPEVSEAVAAGEAFPTADDLGAELAVSATMGLSLARTADAMQTVNRLRSDSNAFASVNQAAAEMADLSKSEDGSHE